MATDLANSPVLNDFSSFFKVWPLFRARTKEALLDKLRPHLVDCVHLIRRLEPQLFHTITTEQQANATPSSHPSPLSSTVSRTSTYTEAPPTISQPPSPTIELRPRTSSAAQSLSVAQKPRPPTTSKYLPGLPEDIRKTICRTTAKEFFRTARDPKDCTDYFLALVQVEKNTWLNAIQQRFLSLGIFHLRERILHQGTRGYNGSEDRWHCTEKAAKDAIVHAAAVNNPDITEEKIRKVISRNISRGKRYMGIAQEFSISAVVSLCPNYTDFYEARLPTEQNKNRRVFISELRAGGAKTTAEFDELAGSSNLLETAARRYLQWIYADCEDWFSRHSEIWLPNENVTLQNNTLRVPQPPNTTETSAPFLNMLAETALSSTNPPRTMARESLQLNGSVATNSAILEAPRDELVRDHAVQHEDLIRQANYSISSTAAQSQAEQNPDSSFDLQSLFGEAEPAVQSAAVSSESEMHQFSEMVEEAEPIVNSRRVRSTPNHTSCGQKRLGDSEVCLSSKRQKNDERTGDHAGTFNVQASWFTGLLDGSIPNSASEESLGDIVFNVQPGWFAGFSDGTFPDREAGDGFRDTVGNNINVQPGWFAGFPGSLFDSVQSAAISSEMETGDGVDPTIIASIGHLSSNTGLDVRPDFNPIIDVGGSPIQADASSAAASVLCFSSVASSSGPQDILHQTQNNGSRQMCSFG
ncbi:hypothetical protein HC256_005557 [Beauveria bassiana]|nr:hypothetical protein HC256_005557 [Beauveria bassiana]